jgi:GNAT superfamily N-acetyltransferase
LQIDQPVEANDAGLTEALSAEPALFSFPSRDIGRTGARVVASALCLIEEGSLPLTSRHGLEIRAATSADASGVAALLAEADHHVDAGELAERLSVLRGAAGTVLIAVRWGPPSGLVVMHWYPTLGAARSTAQITTLLVGAEERRLGIGRLLVKAAAQAARTAGCGNLELLGASAQIDLHAFCRATGFAETGPRFVRSLRKGA